MNKTVSYHALVDANELAFQFSSVQFSSVAVYVL